MTLAVCLTFWRGEASTSPLCENTRSTGAELAGVHRTYSNSGNRKAYSGVRATAETDVGDEETAGELIHTTCIHNNNRVINIRF